MTYEEFIDIVKTIPDIPLYVKKSRENSWSDDRYHQIIDSPKSRPIPIEELYIVTEWETGGNTGGNCWGDDSRPYTTGNPESELTELDVILEKVCPTITFLQYKNLYNTLVKTGNRTEHEYYGNNTEYSHKRVKLHQLFQYLEERIWV